jgi:hypothetical protein
MTTSTLAPRTVTMILARNSRGEIYAETNVALETPAGKTLRIHTSKTSSGALTTSATVGERSSECGFDSFSTIMFQDYSERVESVKVRVTDASVKAQHMKHITAETLAALEAKIIAHYAKLASEE